MKNLIVLSLLFLFLICYGCKYNRPLKTPILYVQEEYYPDTIRSVYDSLIIIAFECGFKNDVFKIYNDTLCITDTITSDTHYHFVIGKRYPLNYYGQEYIEIKLNHGFKHKIKLHPSYGFIYIRYRLGILSCEFTNISKIYF